MPFVRQLLTEAKESSNMGWAKFGNDKEMGFH